MSSSAGKSPLMYGGCYLWCRLDVLGHGGGLWMSSLPYVLDDDVFDKLTGGRFVPADYENSVMACREYTTPQDAIDDLASACGSP